MTSDLKVPPPEGSITSQTPPAAGNYVCKHLWETAHLQTTKGITRARKPKTVSQKSISPVNLGSTLSPRILGVGNLRHRKDSHLLIYLLIH